MKQLFKENFTIEQIQNIFDDWNNKGVLYGWEDIEASKVQKLLEQNGYNLDSIKVMREAFDTLYLLNREAHA
ncbi:hypothetical protein GMNKNHGO_00125 [Enterococcus phage vB_Efa29212_3e]|uniref:Uncharacterized protein n=1 Tax=Enterococcus phage vB_Efa29212_3e TaxID=2982224 RepID=A0A978ACP9_9CAUD|nr:hypothetical protein GMNKNHGO_00125 [Enterococcus phage vB_Efa29212_3e]